MSLRCGIGEQSVPTTGIIRLMLESASITGLNRLRCIGLLVQTASFNLHEAIVWRNIGRALTENQKLSACDLQNIHAENDELQLFSP